MAVPAKGTARSPNRKHERETFFKYTSADVAGIVLRTRRLRWSSPILFDDLFDSPRELRLHFDEAELLRAFVEHIAGLIEGGSTPAAQENPAVRAILAAAAAESYEVRQAMASELRAKMRVPSTGMSSAMADVRKMWRDSVPNFRVLCVSETNDVMPLWAQYADNLHGCVLELAALDATDSALLAARAIQYQDDPPQVATATAWVRCLASGRLDVYWPMFEEYLYVKSTAWAYQKEWRVAAPSNRPGETGLFSDYGFDARELVGIYFGPRVTEAKRDELLGLLVGQFDHVQAYTSRPHGRLNTFDFTRIK